MTRRHFVAIAEVIAGDIAVNRDNPAARRAVVNVTLSLAQTFKRDNPRFDTVRFLTACGITAEDAPTCFGTAA